MTEADSGVSLSEKALQLVFPGFKFGLDDPSEAERLTDLGVGGFCLYGGQASEVAEFTRRLQARARVPLLFCADYEDGLASQSAGGTELPPNMGIGASGQESLAFQKGLIAGLEARAVGVRWVLAPVLDLATCPANPIVNVRAFGADPSLAARLGIAFMKGLRSAGVLSCAKHFPGHGETSEDSHLRLPALRVTRARLVKRELVPFKRAAAQADAVMVAHLRVPALGDAAKVPASLSRDALRLLRRDLRFQRLAVTDALSMNAVAERWSDEEAGALALAAGADILLVPAKPAELAYALSRRVESDRRLAEPVDAAYWRLRKAKADCGLFKDRGIGPREDQGLAGCAKHRETAERMAAECLAWVRGGPWTTPPRAVRYLEPDTHAPEDWQGRTFAAVLQASGVPVRPYAPEEEGPVVVGSYLRPRAYTGRIRYSPTERRAVQAALSGQKDAVLVSFGSPFVFDDIKGWRAGLCAFGASEASQRAAARALLGKAQARGRMPVPLKALKN